MKIRMYLIYKNYFSLYDNNNDLSNTMYSGKRKLNNLSSEKKENECMIE